ncbi:MAG: hypothetical protein KGS44_12305 [Alphaproteobacteria bacterium]|nr:hypothetical protein [Alphaproteobacteria bacterium]
MTAIFHAIRSIRLYKRLPKAPPQGRKTHAGHWWRAAPWRRNRNAHGRRALSATTAANSLRAVLGPGEVDEDELYDDMDRRDAAQEALVQHQAHAARTAAGTLAPPDTRAACPPLARL